MAQNLDKGNVYQAAKRANLNPAQMQQINSFTEMYSMHSRLSGLPQNIASQQYSKLPPEQQTSMAAFFGPGKQDPEKPQRSFIEQAAYIVSRPIVEPIKAVFNVANWLSDQTTRLYRVGAIATTENMNLADAWKKSGARGEEAFNPDRIERAVQLYGADRVAVAKRIAAGVPLEQIIAEAPNQAQKRIAAEGSQNKDELLTEAIAKVNAAKYSPGRQIANAFLPEDLEGKGAIYTWLSGSADAAFRVTLDPTLILGKAAKVYRGAQYALKYTAGSVENVTRAFDTNTIRGRNITRFWEEYTDLTSQLVKAREANDINKVGEITGQLRRLNPGFMDNNVTESLIKYANENYDGTISLTTAKGFLSDAQNIDSLMYGQPGYWVKYMPRLSATRKKRLEFYTNTSRVFDLNKDSADFLRNIAFDEADLQGITPGEALLRSLVGREGETPVQAGQRTGERLLDDTKAQEIFKSRWSLGAINRRLDKFFANFSRIPIARDLKNLDSDRSIRAIGQMARPIYGRFGARVIEDYYRVANLGQRRLIAQGLAVTVLKVRGADAVPAGRRLIETMGNMGRDVAYSNPVYEGKQLFPKVAEYLDGGSGGLVENRSTVGFVKTEFLADMPGNKALNTEAIEAYRKSLREGKGFAVRDFEDEPFNDPIMVVYDNETGKAFVGEGNHRLQAAIAENIPYVPVRVVRGRTWEMEEDIVRGRFPKQIKNDKNPQFPETTGPAKGTVRDPKYLPPDFHPKYVFDEEALVERDFIPGGPEGRLPSMNASGKDSALYPSQMSDSMAMPFLDEMDKVTGRDGILGSILGVTHKKAADDIIDSWTTLTILGPRFPVRNAIEDFIVGFASSVSVRGFIRGRRQATKIRTMSQELELGMINALVKKGKSKEVADEFALVDKGEYKMANGDIAESPSQKELAKRQILAKGLLDSKFDDAAKGQFGNLYDQYVYEFAMYGDYENIMKEVADGAYSFAMGMNASSVATRAQRKRGKVVDYTLDNENYKRIYGGDFTPRALDNETKVGWAFQINFKARDPLGAEALVLLRTYKNNKDLFVAKLSEIISESRFDKMRKGMERYEDLSYTPSLHAAAVYDDIRAMVSKRNGDINFDLLDKIVKPNKFGKLEVDPNGIKSINDLPTELDDLPIAITVPKLVPVSETGNFVSDLMRWGWDKAGDANARFSRDALVIDASFHIRKDLEPFRDQLEKSFISSGMSAEYAKDAATRRVIELSENLAVERVASFVDNPEVRSYLAWNMRNIARFYRATEDAYRRLYRVARYSPEGIRKVALTYEGVTHAGFVQRDDQGEAYFIYPGVAPVYAAVNKALNLFGLGDKFVTPMPLQFGASLKMLTPSADPDSWIPTFSGPLASVPMKLVYKMAGAVEKSDIPFLSKTAAEIASTEKYVLGKYSEDSDLVNAFLPGHINKALNLMDSDERDSQYASAFRKAITYLEAGGHTPPDDATPAQLEQYQDRLKATIHSILGVRFAAGFFVPASPGIQLKSDMAAWVRDNGRTNFKQVWNKLLQKYEGSPDPVGTAMAEWVRLFPDQVPFTVSESDPRVEARFKTSQEAAAWVENNRELLRAYPEGAAYLIPQTGEFTYDAYKTLKSEGFRQNKLVGDFLRDVFVQRSKQYYFEQRDLYEDDLAAAATDDQKREIKAQWDSWSKEYRQLRPLLELDLSESASRTVLRSQSYEDLKKMLNQRDIKTPAANSLRQMVKAYEDYRYNIEVVYNSRSQEDVEARANLKDAVLIELKDIASTNANASAAFYALFANLLRN